VRQSASKAAQSVFPTRVLPIQPSLYASAVEPMSPR